ncbi:kinase-like protein [Coprinopsis sp. MPI-PUGE-AT-0042]|nr:kinase-like protein [Coprinopsis sp. MPI-PUGE-AT-0042]
MKRLSRILSAAKDRRRSRSTVSISQHLPVTPGQTLDSRFRIIKQLGSGQHSTVWLVESDQGPRALKILTNEVTAFQGKEAFELEVLKNIALVQAGKRQKLLIQLEHHFNVRGEHGDHLCLVTAPLGHSLLDVASRFESKRLPIPLVKRVTRQLLEGLDILHGQCQTVHTDIKQDNIMLGEASLSESDDIDLGSLNEANFVLIDFGTAIPPSGPHSRLIQPAALRAPEVIIGCTWNTKVDIWNLGCIVAELIIGQHLFKPRPFGKSSAEQYHLARMFATSYPKALPPQVMDAFREGEHFEKYFHDKGLRLSADPEPIEAILRVYNVHTPELSAILTAMLRIVPDERATAKDLLAFEWLREED